jgi:anti-anti-sigma regulatory factor
MNLGDQLQKLDVRGCVLSAGTVQTIAESCPKLVALDLARVESIDDNLAKVLANGLPHLRYLSLCGCSKITDGNVNLLRNHWRG